MPLRAPISLRPVFALLTALALGITAASRLPLPIPIPALLIAIIVLLAASMHTIRRQHRGNALCLLLAFFCSG
jgi:hypothetical protein